MTQRRRLIPLSEVESTLETLRKCGVEVGAVDIRTDGITVYPPSEGQGGAYDSWKKQNNSAN